MADPNVRPEMVTSAISFLSDPKVQSSTLSQRVSFLESKGLNASEIDEALRQAGQSAGPGAVEYAGAGPSRGAPAYYPQQRTYGPQYGAYPPNAAAQQQGMDWRDWFIMAVVSGTVGYGVISLARKYLLPHLQPPNATALESDRDALTAKYDEVASQLAALDDETRAIRAGVEEQRMLVEEGIREVEEAVKGMRDADKRREDEMRRVKEEVDHIKDSLPKMIEQTRSAQTASLTELQTELKSLKSLLVSRNTGPTTSARPSFFGSTTAVTSGSGASSPGNGGAAASGEGSANNASSNGGASPSQAPASPFAPPVRPSIPAWQLAGGSGTSDKASE